MQIYGIIVSVFELVHEILELIAYVIREGSDGPGYRCSLTRPVTAFIQSNMRLKLNFRAISAIDKY